MTETPAPTPPPAQEVSVPLPIVKPYVTYGLLVILAVVYLAQLYTNQMSNYRAQPILEWGVIDFTSVLNGQYYRLLTAMFLHFDNAHILFNGLALYYTGIVVERFFGHIRFALIYLLSGLLGSVAVFILSHDGVTAGASGAIFGIFGAQVIFFYRNRQVLGASAMRALRSSGIIIALNLGLTLYSQFAPNALPISLWGHVGGLAGGLLLGWYLTPLYRVERDTSSPIGLKIVDGQPLEKRWYVPAFYAVVMVVMFVLALIVFSQGTQFRRIVQQYHTRKPRAWDHLLV